MHEYLYFRRVWDRPAAFHLARMRCRTNAWPKRLVSALWLIQERVPLNGAVPSLNFKGL